jgi:exonuclease SbcC
LRLSISKLLTDSSGRGPGFIVLDEIFGSQDPIRRNKVMETINGLRRLYKQVIVITHVDNVKDMIPNAIEVTEGEDRNSVITLDYQLMSP